MHLKSEANENLIPTPHTHWRTLECWEIYFKSLLYHLEKCEVFCSPGSLRYGYNGIILLSLHYWTELLLSSCCLSCSLDIILCTWSAYLLYWKKKKKFQTNIFPNYYLNHLWDMKLVPHNMFSYFDSIWSSLLNFCLHWKITQISLYTLTQNKAKIHILLYNFLNVL